MYTYIHIYTCTYKYIHIYIYTYMHTHVGISHLKWSTSKQLVLTHEPMNGPTPTDIHKYMQNIYIYIYIHIRPRMEKSHCGQNACSKM